MEEKNLADKFYFERCVDPRIIPFELIQQNKEKDYSAEFFYKNALLNRHNPMFILEVMRKHEDHKRKIYGYLWMDFDPSCEALFVHTFSVKKELWGSRKHLNALKNHLQYCKEKLGCKVRWLSNRPKLFERMGFHKTKTVMFEVK